MRSRKREQNPAAEGERAASFENRRLALKATYEKAIGTLGEVNRVGFEHLTETERDLVDFVKTMLTRKLAV